MGDPADVEKLNQEGLGAFAERREEPSPVAMLNLLAFEADGGRERYEEYGTAVAPIFEQAGGRILYAGRPAPAMIGDQSWDMVIIAEYPTRQAFLDMVTSPEYQEITHLRTEGLARAELHPMDPADDLPTSL
jgi:uncharacterized protein (DUF1330 family)